MITAWWVNIHTRCVLEALPEVGEQRPDPQHDVRPALPAGRLVVELADLGATLRLVGVQVPDALAGEPVELPQVALTEPFVEQDLDVDDAKGGLRGPGGAGVGRRDDDGRALVLGQRLEVRTQGVGLRLPRVGQLDVRVPLLQVEPVGLLSPRLGVGQVAKALAGARPA